MKIRHLILTTFLCLHTSANAANLIEVFRQAQMSDPVFHQAIAERLSTKQGVPINVATLLPNIMFTLSPSLSRVGFSGSNFDPVMSNSGTYINPRNLTERGYTMNLTLTQTVFDFAKFSTVSEQLSLSSEADATLNAELQNLMTRVASAYFQILEDEDNLSYAEASKMAYGEQLDQIQQQFKVGIKTQTDVYTAQASYSSALATYIAAQTTLSNDRENLREMTGIYYTHLSSLSDDFPLVSPQPQNVDEWVSRALLQNWSIKAARCHTVAVRAIINEQFAGHLPTLNVQTQFSRVYEDNINNYASFTERNGPGTTSDRSITLNLNVPIFSGGGVVAKTNKAVYDYQAAQQKLEQTTRETLSTTRKSYLNVIAGISQVKADKEAVKSSISSLEGLEASYRVGTETLVDVLNQQQKVYEAQKQYATDRYAFVNNVLELKKAAGTLSINDLRLINAWLVDKQRKVLSKREEKKISRTKHSQSLHLTQK